MMIGLMDGWKGIWSNGWKRIWCTGMMIGLMDGWKGIWSNGMMIGLMDGRESGQGWKDNMHIYKYIILCS